MSCGARAEFRSVTGQDYKGSRASKPRHGAEPPPVRLRARGCAWPCARARASAQGGSFVRTTPSGVGEEHARQMTAPPPHGLLQRAGGVRPLGYCRASEGFPVSRAGTAKWDSRTGRTRPALR